MLFRQLKKIKKNRTYSLDFCQFDKLDLGTELRQKREFFGQKTLCLDLESIMLRKVDILDPQEINVLINLSQKEDQDISYDEEQEIIHSRPSFDQFYVVIKKSRTKNSNSEINRAK